MRSSTPAADAAPGAPLLATVVEALPPGPAQVVRAARALARAGRPAWVVGGLVRDVLLGRSSEDVDLMVEAPGPGVLPGDDPFVLALARAVGAAVTVHPRFLTAVLALPSGVHVDVAQARVERYAAPAQLPEVAAGRFGDDLRRRDFATGAMAVDLHEDGALVDPLGGLGDLRAGILRVLHPGSFVDDPTRLLRGSRFAARLGWRFDAETADLARACARGGLLERLSAKRLGAEVAILAAEPCFPDALAFLAAHDALPALGLDAVPAEIEAALRALGALPLAEATRVGAALTLLTLAAPEARRADAHARWDVAGARGEAMRARAAALGPTRALVLGGAPPSRAVPAVEALGEEGAAALVALAGAQGRDAIEGTLARRGERPPITGRDVQALGVAPGPRVGAVLGALRAAWLDGTVRDRGEALALARELLEAP